MKQGEAVKSSIMVDDTNLDVAEFLAHVTNYAMDLRRSSPLAPPKSGADYSILPPCFLALEKPDERRTRP